ncbi:MAG: MtrB/PioB family outer membrane beta-barrel protein [Hyphomicrobiales bacterium]|nr:MtrB/PioB family outer membrane beta-barrel protein [Hyphomicrobiales bacterium]
MLTCRTRLMIASATCALLVGLAPMSKALAADLPTRKAPVPMLLDSSWYTEGDVTVGGRFFVNDPKRANMPGLGDSLASYYKYSTLKPGPFSDIWLAAGTRDGVRRVELFGKNIGYTDQRYGFDYSHAGKYYIDLLWDQTPHVYGMGAQTLYNGVGGNLLTVNPALGSYVTGLLGAKALSAANWLPIWPQAWNAMNAFSNQTDIKVERNTGRANFRWTPNDDWDVHANYEIIRRDGTMPFGMIFNNNSSNGVVSNVPQPVHDTTHNYSINAEYAGQSWWDKAYTFKLGYVGSQYKDDSQSYIVQNPFCNPVGAVAPATCAGAFAGQPLFGLMSLPPNNAVNGANATLAVDLPWKARYVGTFSFNNMTQNQPYLPFSFAFGDTTASWGGVAPYASRSSLGGNINTILLNNVVTKEVNKELKAKLTYRLYDFDNQTPSTFITNWVVADAGTATPAAGSTYAPARNFQMAYTKQNATAELNYRPWKELNLNAAYLFEHYDWKQEAATSTTENGAKASLDWKPSTWFTLRGTGTFLSRTANNYDQFVNQMSQAYLGWANLTTLGPLLTSGTGVYGNPDYRAFYLNGRHREKFDLFADITVLPGLTVTPTFQFTDDRYSLNGSTTSRPVASLNGPLWIQEGIRHQRNFNTGIDVGYQYNPYNRIFASYMYGRGDQLLRSGTPTAYPGASTTAMYEMNVAERTHVARIGFESSLIPNRLKFEANYTKSLGHASQIMPFPQATTAAGLATFWNYPNTDTDFQRVETKVKYTFEDSWLKGMGLTGKMSATLGYTFEKNKDYNYQMETLNYAYSVANTSAYLMNFMGWYNPNYTVHRIGAALNYKW